MADLFDYLSWRGDLSFTQSELNEVDNMIFNMIVYVDFDKVKLNLTDPQKFSDVSGAYFSIENIMETKLGVGKPTKNIHKLFEKMAVCERFGELYMSDYVNQISHDAGYQFCACTFHLNEYELLVSFRGTDDTIAGWREDFNLSYMEEVPSQRKAVEYLRLVAQKYKDKNIYIGGHSKGGNLAVYSAIHADNNIKNKIIKIFNNDGPGFQNTLINSEEYKSVANKINTLIPQSSLVGIMFDHGGKHQIVKSKQVGILQHDSFSWQLQGTSFLRVEELSSRGKKNEEHFKNSMNNMTLEEKKNFVETLFGMLDQTGAKTLMDLQTIKLRDVIHTINSLDKNQKQMINTIIFKLVESKL